MPQASDIAAAELLQSSRCLSLTGQGGHGHQQQGLEHWSSQPIGTLVTCANPLMPLSWPCEADSLPDAGSFLSPPLSDLQSRLLQAAMNTSRVCQPRTALLLSEAQEQRAHVQTITCVDRDGGDRMDGPTILKETLLLTI